MSMAKKLLLVGGVVVAVIVVTLFMTAVMPVIITLTGFAHYTGNNSYPGFNEAVTTAPLWIYFIPILPAGATIIFIIRGRER